MGKSLLLVGALLCLSLTATAQDSTATFDVSSPASEAAAPASLYPSDRSAWQLGFGYQYQHYNVLGQSFHNNGFHADITRYVNNWLGFEGTAVGGFGHNKVGTLNLVAKSFFVGGGPHIAANNHTRFEPWFHALVGLQHFRFTQTNNVLGLGSNSALGFMGGGGVDIKFGGGISWRLQADYIGTHFNSGMQTNYSFGSGLVLNF